MVINLIRANSFGILSGAELGFSNYINIIEAHDDNIKNALRSFIKYILYGEYDKTEITDPDGSMAVEVNQKSYSIERHGDENAKITDLADGKIVFDGKIPGEALLGIKKNFYAENAFITRTPDNNSLPLVIDNLIKTGFDDYSIEAAEAALRDEQEQLSNDEGSGKLNLSEGKLAALRAELVKSLESRARIIEIEDEKIEKRKSLMEQNDAVEKQEAFELICRYARVIELFDALHTKEEARKTISAEIEKYRAQNGYNGFCPDESYKREVALGFKAIRDCAEALNEAINETVSFNSSSAMDKRTEEIVARAEALGGTESVRKNYDKAHSSSRSFFITAIACIVISLFSVTFDLAFPVINTTPIWHISCILLALFALFATALATKLCLDQRKAYMKIAADFDVTEPNELQNVLRRIDETKKRIQQRKERSEQIKELVFTASSDYDRAFEAFRISVEKWGKSLPSKDLDSFVYSYNDLISAYIDGENAIVQRLIETKNSIADLREKLKIYDEINVRAGILPKDREYYRSIDYNAVCDELNAMRDIRNSIVSEIDSLERERNEILTDLRSPAVVREEILLTESQIELLRKQRNASESALSAISTVKERLSVEFTPAITSAAAELFRSTFDSKTEEETAESENDDNTQRLIAVLKSESRALVYSALKISIVNQACEEKTTLFLDEHITHREEDRRRLFKIISHLTDSGNQIFMFTSNPRDFQLARDLHDGTRQIKLSEVTAK